MPLNPILRLPARSAVFRRHRSIGRAIYYTSETIMRGFSPLAFASFIPTIYFGLFTSFAMLAALPGNVTLLPLLMVRFHAMEKVVTGAKP